MSYTLYHKGIGAVWLRDLLVWFITLPLNSFWWMCKRTGMEFLYAEQRCVWVCGWYNYIMGVSPVHSPTAHQACISYALMICMPARCVTNQDFLLYIYSIHSYRFITCHWSAKSLMHRSFYQTCSEPSLTRLHATEAHPKTGAKPGAHGWNTFNGGKLRW